ncbi:MAG: hypothetical protein JKY66_08785 [Spongiibacteraceae bacterium]|nr:hypothetical protein [Spongiibacteraceae bacterium]
MATYTKEWQKELEGGGIEDNLGEPGYNRWGANSRLRYTRGHWTGAWSVRYIGHGTADNDFSADVYADNAVDEQFYHDVYVSFAVEDDVGYEFFAGIKNIENNEPPYIPSPSSNSDTGTGTAAAVYDVIGRYYYAGVKVRF